MKPSISLCERYALDLVARTRSARDAFEFRCHALDAFARLVGCDTAVFAGPPSERKLATVGVDAAGLKTIEYCEQNLERYAAEVGTILSALQRLGGVLDRDFFSLRDRSRLAFYSEVVRPQDIDSMLVLSPKWRGRSLGMLRLQRCRATAFGNADLALAMQLLPAVEVGLAALHATLPDPELTLPKLGRREAEIAIHVARGLTTPQIACLLGTSKFTVRNQIGKIFDKLGVASRAELAACITVRQATSR